MHPDEPHRRYNPLTKRWLLVSPHRAKRPWQGQEEPAAPAARPAYDPKCYLCPGNARVQGDANPKYESTYVFPNDFAAVRTQADLEKEYKDAADSANTDVDAESGENELFRAEQMTGRCVVICFSPRHDLTLASMPPAQLQSVVRVWQEVYTSAQTDPEVAYCQIFENKGAAMGCSNPHPHGQAWMTSVVPEEPAIERIAQEEYRARHPHGAGLLGDYVAAELRKRERVVFSNASFAVLVPYWAVWPFEALVVARRKVSRVTDLTEEEQAGLAECLSQLTVRYDNLFKTSFPYSMGIHQAPVTAQDNECADPVEHLHLHFYPPLLRSATVRKFLVGFEMLGMAQRDLTPETAAAMLRNVSGTERYDAV